MHGDKPDGKKNWKDVVWKKHSYNERTVLKSGSYLNCFCPHCDANLMKDHMIHLETVTEDGETGWVALSPYLNSFEHVSDIHLPENHEVADLKCGFCKASLMVEGRTCERGDSHVACVMVASPPRGCPSTSACAKAATGTRSIPTTNI